MDKFIKTSRVIALGLALAVIVGIYGLTLYRIQAIDTEAILEDTGGSVAATTYAVHAARGSLLDRNGVLLSSDRTIYDIRISRQQLLQQPDRNTILLNLIRAANRFGVEYTDNFPVTMAAPFEYLVNMSSTQRSRMRSYFEYFTESLHVADPDDPGITATQLISWMREHYGIDYTVTAEDARKIIGVRFELEIGAILGANDYVFATDVSQEFVSYISELSLASVTIETRSTRVYHTDYAAHLLGYVGAMTEAQYENKYKDLGYPLNALVGRDGAEQAFEEYLHGTDGSVTIYTDETGAVVNKVVNSEAKAGSNVYLTVDIGLQKVAEDALASTIGQLNRDRTEEYEKALAQGKDVKEPEMASGGGVVAVDVRTGEVLALASYPTFKLSTFYEDFDALNSDPASPMLNRATYGNYNPGSTFKMVTALAALRSGTISRWTTIRDQSVYMAYAQQNFTPTCWIYPGSHGTLDVVGALEQSCNYFFYTVADEMGISSISEAAELFGFGQHTGIEIGDDMGTVASVESKRRLLNESWWNADTLLACIGQGLNLFTPVQMANYVATIAADGVRHNLTCLHSVASFDYSDVLLRREPRIAGVIDDPEGYLEILQEGMRAVAKTGTAASALADYPIPVAAKTGTVQLDSSSINDGIFVCYAPADDPQIAIAVVVQKGGSGSRLITIARDLLDYWFQGTDDWGSGIVQDNSLVR